MESGKFHKKTRATEAELILPLTSPRVRTKKLFGNSELTASTQHPSSLVQLTGELKQL